MKLKSLCYSIALLLVIFPIIGSAASPSSISVNMSPENPEPFENVDISISSYANNLDTVFISWSVDNKVSLTGIGKKSFSLTAPSADKESTVLVKISLPDGDVELRILVKPSSMVMLWQADDSHVPPFYRGKALPSADSSIKVVAMPEIRNAGVLINPKNMSYSWELDYDNDQGASGYGKNYYVYRNDYLENASTVDVSVLTVDQKYTSAGTVRVGSYQPKILFYSRDSKLGTMWENTIKDNYLIKNEEIIEAVPYFISPQNVYSPSLSWTWSINDELANTESIIKNILPLKIGGGASGSAKIRVDINNIYKIFQTTTNQVTVRF